MGVCGLSIVNVEQVAKELTDIYKTLKSYELLPNDFNQIVGV